MLNEREPIKGEVRGAREAARRARERARIARWDMNIVIFLFAILVIVIILLSEDVGTVIVAPIALVGLAVCWFTGWRREKELYELFYDEEQSKSEQEPE